MAEAVSHDQSSTTDKTVGLEPEKQVLQYNDVDAALEFLNTENTSVTEVDEKILVRKIDWRVVPLLCKSLSTGRQGT